MYYIVGILLEWTIVLLIVSLWVLVRMICLIARIWWAYPHNKWLWTITAMTIFFTLLALILQNGHIGSVAGAAFVTLALTAKIIEWANAQTYLDEPAPLIQLVLHRHWWDMDIA